MAMVDERLVEPAKAEDFRCAICTDIAVEIVETVPCGHLFCESCMKLHFPLKTSCPTCRDVMSGWRPIEYLRRQVGNLRVHCTKRPREDSKDGCEEVYLLSQESKHKKLCLWTEVSCRCGALVARREMEHHSKLICPKRTVQCTFCAWAGEATSRATHEGACPRRPVTCRYCNAQEEQQALAQHEEVCDARVVPCPVCKEEVRQGDLDTHVRATPGHIRSLCTEVKRLRGFLEERDLLRTYLHPPFSLFFEINGKMSSVLAHATDTIEEIRRKLPVAEGRRHLLWRGKFLRDEFSLDFYSLVSCNVSQPIQIVA